MAGPRFAVRHSPIHGRGVFALKPLPEGSRLLEYQGERIQSEQAAQRYGNNSALGGTYLFAVNSEWLIDGQVGGNSARFINHSCTPNCEAVIWVDLHGDARKDRVFIETRRQIEPGEELTFDYALELAGDQVAKYREAWRCRCGSPQCRGSMLSVESLAAADGLAEQQATER